MLSNRLAFAALAIACIGAAAGGGFLATRQNTVPAPMSAQSQPATVAPTAAPATAAAPAGQPILAEKPVQETEAIVAPATPAVASKTSAAPKKPESAAPRAVATTRNQPPAKTVAHQEPVPALSSSWPSSTAQPPAPAVPPPAEAAPRVEERPLPEPPRAPEPPARTFEELVVSSDSVLGLQTETRVSSETARVEDKVEARVTRDVRVGGRVAIPSGARALGSVTLVERGGKIKDRARLGVRFHTLVLADGTRIPISTDPIYRDGESPKASSSQKIGGAAVGGAIIGAILGGAKGMAIGAGAGAGAGTVMAQAGDRNAAILASGSPLTVRILQPVTVTVDGKN